MNWLLQYRYLAQPTSSDTPPTRAQVREVKRKRPSENALTPCARIRVQRAFPDGPAALVRRSPPTARVTVLWHTAIAWTPRVPVAECSKLYQSHLYALRSVSYRREEWSNAPMTLMSALMSAWRNAPAMRSSRCGQNKRVRHSPLAHAHLEHMQKPGGPSCSSPSCSSSSSSSSPLNSSVSSCILSIGANRPPPS